MNSSLKILKTDISKKLILQFYFVFFIIINFVDFLGYLTGDLDIFKKILSWSIIAYIFYKASLSKVFIGTKKKIFDILYIIAFSFVALPKSIMHYVNLDSLNEQKFYIFNFLVEILQSQNRTKFEINTSIIGLILIIIISIWLLKKSPPTENSLIGSLKFNDYLEFLGFRYYTLIITAIFFAVIVFNFFMEWFALAVDSLILVLGLIFYIAKYLHHHTELETSFLKSIANTGNAFYQNLIEKFSNKKTFLIGVSLILTLHLVVDIGVYLIPYTIGNGNTLYSESLNTPIINLIEPKNSQIYADLTNSNSLIIDFTVILIHLSTIIFYFLIMISPFYYFYKFIQNYKTHTPIFIKYLLLTSAILYLLIIIMPDLNAPISIDLPAKESGILGVELKTTPIIENFTNKTVLNLLVVLLSFFIIHSETMLLLKKSSSRFIKFKLTPLISLIFFTIYISLFFVSNFETQTQNIQESIFQSHAKDNSEKYSYIMNNLNNSNIIIKYNEIPLITKSSSKKILTKGSVFPIREKINQTSYNDYLVLNFEKIDTSFKYEINNIENAIFEDKSNYKNFEFSKNNLQIIYFLGTDIYTKSLTERDIKGFVSHIISLKKNQSQTILEYIRIILTSIFYIFGSLAFIKLFIREKIKN